MIRKWREGGYHASINNAELSKRRATLALVKAIPNLIIIMYDLKQLYHWPRVDKAGCLP